MDVITEKIAHLFHWPLYADKQIEFLQLISLPIGSKGVLKYDSRWINTSFFSELENIKKQKNYSAIFWALSCNIESGIKTFHYAFPLRYLKIIDIIKIGNEYLIVFIADEFIFNPKRYDNTNDYENLKHLGFNSNQLNILGKDSGLVYTCPKINELPKSDLIEFDTVSILLKDINKGSENEIKISEYPIIIIEDIDGSNINEAGEYELKLNKEYTIILSIFQGEEMRSERINIDGSVRVGKIIQNMSLTKIVEHKRSTMAIRIKRNNLEYEIYLPIKTKAPLLKKKYAPLIVMASISTLAIFIIYFCILDSKNADIKLGFLYAAVIPIITLLIGHLLELSKSK